LTEEKSLSDVTPPQDCKECPASANRRNVVCGNGPVDAELMLVGEAPGRNEDRLGKPFVGAAGEILNRILKETGLDREKIYITNVVKCRPTDDQGNNRTPTKDEITTCCNYLEAEISTINPKIICPMGGSALTYFLPAQTISRVHGNVFGSLEVEGTVIIPLYHPAYGIYDNKRIPELIDDMKIVAGTLRDIREPTIVVVTGEPGQGMSYQDVSVSSSTCGRCGKTLTAPRSVAAGLGPVCYMRLFGKPQPPAPGERPKISKRSKRISKIDLSQMVDVREWFR